MIVPWSEWVSYSISYSIFENSSGKFVGEILSLLKTKKKETVWGKMHRWLEGKRVRNNNQPIMPAEGGKARLIVGKQ